MIYKSKIQRILELQRENERLRAENIRLIERVGVDMSNIAQPELMEGEEPLPSTPIIPLAGRVDTVEEAVSIIAETLL